MKIADARAWLTARSSRVRIEGGHILIGIPLDIAEKIAALLPPEIPVVHPEQPIQTDPQPETVMTTTREAAEAPVEIHSQRIDTSAPRKPEKVVDTESGPVRVPAGPVKVSKKKVAKKKKRKR